MELLSGGHTPKDEALCRKYREKLEKGDIGAADLKDGFVFFARICNDTDGIRYEMRELALNFQFNLDDEVYTIAFEGGVCASYRGAPEKPTVIFNMSKKTVVDILKGNIYSLVAQMGGYIKYTGPKPQAQVFQRLFELFLDRFLKLDLEDLKKAAAGIRRPAGVVKFGVIGGGQAFFFHSNGDRGSDIIAYTAIYDRNYENAKKMALTYKDGILVPYDNLDEMLASDIDAVLVMVPHVYHVEMVCRAAAAGKHVLCEKPMGTTVEGCRKMIAACKQAGVKFMIAENHRFLPAHVYMHDIVKQGLIGDVLMVRAYEGVDEIDGLSRSGFWKGDPIKAGGGALMDMAAHKFDTIEYVIGSKVEEVTACLAKRVITLPEKAEDNAVAIARYENGALADVMVSFTQQTTPYNSMEVFGTKGSIFENHGWEKPVRFCSYDERMGENQQKWVEPDIEHDAFP